MARMCPTCGYENRDDAAYCGMCKAVFRPKAVATTAKAAPAGRRPAPNTPPPTTPTSGAASTALDHPTIARDLAARPDPFLASFGVVLDRSLASLRLLDAFIDETWGTEGDAPDDDAYRPSRGKQNVIVGFGSYLGEVIRDHVGGAWRDDPAHPGNPAATALVMGEARVFPIARVFKRFRDGASEPLHQLAFHAIRELPPARLAECAPAYQLQAEHFASTSALPEARVRVLAAELLRIAAGLDPARAARLDEGLAALDTRIAEAGRSRGDAPAPAREAPAAPPPAADAAPPPVVQPPAPTPGSLSRRALDLLIAGELDAARDPLRAWARAVDPTLDAPGWIARAEALPSDTGLGDLLVHYGAAAAVTPDFVAAWRELGVGLALWGAGEAALAALDRALAIAPTDTIAWNHKGVAFMRMNQPGEALACWDRVLSLAPRDPGAWRNKGAALVRLGRPREQALDAFERALELDDTNAPTWYSRGECELFLGRGDAARRSFERCLALPGANAATRAAAERHLASLAGQA